MELLVLSFNNLEVVVSSILLLMLVVDDDDDDDDDELFFSFSETGSAVVFLRSKKTLIAILISSTLELNATCKQKLE